MKLSEIETWHPVVDLEKVAQLVAAYQRGDAVPPVIVMEQDGRYPVALSGVHRIAALREIYDADTEITEITELSVYDVDVLCEDASKEQIDALSQCYPPKGDAADVIRALLPLFEDAADRAALETQR